MQKPSPARMVLIKGIDKTMNNGSDTAPAIVTRAYSDTLINVRVLVDGPSAPLWLTSVTLVDDQAAAEAKLATGLCTTVAYWPPRI